MIKFEGKGEEEIEVEEEDSKPKNLKRTKEASGKPAS